MRKRSLGEEKKRNTAELRRVSLPVIKSDWPKTPFEGERKKRIGQNRLRGQRGGREKTWNEFVEHRVANVSSKKKAGKWGGRSVLGDKEVARKLLIH